MKHQHTITNYRDEEDTKRRKLIFSSLYTHEEIQKKKFVDSIWEEYEQNARRNFEFQLANRKQNIQTYSKKLYDSHTKMKEMERHKNIYLQESKNYNNNNDLVKLLKSVPDMMTTTFWETRDRVTSIVHDLNCVCRSINKINYAGRFWNIVKISYDKYRNNILQPPLKLRKNLNMPYQHIRRIFLCKECYVCRHFQRKEKQKLLDKCPACKNTELISLVRNKTKSTGPQKIFQDKLSDLCTHNNRCNIYVTTSETMVKKKLSQTLFVTNEK